MLQTMCWSFCVFFFFVCDSVRFACSVYIEMWRYIWCGNSRGRQNKMNITLHRKMFFIVCIRFDRWYSVLCCAFMLVFFFQVSILSYMCIHLYFVLTLSPTSVSRDASFVVVHFPIFGFVIQFEYTETLFAYVWRKMHAHKPKQLYVNITNL